MIPSAPCLAEGDLLVTVDLAARQDGRTTRVRAQHGIRGDRVTAVSASRTGVAQVTHLLLADWPAELLSTAVTTPLAASRMVRRGVPCC